EFGNMLQPLAAVQPQFVSSPQPANAMARLVPSTAKTMLTTIARTSVVRPSRVVITRIGRSSFRIIRFAPWHQRRSNRDRNRVLALALFYSGRQAAVGDPDYVRVILDVRRD